MTYVHQQLRLALYHFEKTAGKKPSCAYLGQNEMDELMRWAVTNEYVSEKSINKITGDSRPEVFDIPIYLVNDLNHLRVS